MAKQETSTEFYSRETAYERWVREQNIPVIEGYFIPDIKTAHLEPWERKGGLGCFVHLEGSIKNTLQMTAGYICEIPPGKELKPQKHMYEELVYIAQGRGATTVRTDNGPERTFEWQEGSFFSPPLNTWYQHFNGQGDEPVRYFAMTNAPLVMNLFHSDEFMFNNPFVFKDRYNSEEDYFSQKGKLYVGNAFEHRIWDTNFVPDAKKVELVTKEVRGAKGKSVRFEMSSNTMAVHIYQFHVGTYLKAHRHGPGTHIIILTGKGYSLIWPEGVARKKIDWHPGSVFVPPINWYHQHFNSGNIPARYIAFHRGGHKFPGLKGMGERVSNQIEYEEEDPEVRELFREECAKSGVEEKMEPFFSKKK